MKILSKIKHFFQKTEPENTELIPFIRYWLAQSRRSNTYKYPFYNLCNKLSAFEKYNKTTLYTDSFTESMTEAFIYYFQNYYEKNLLQNTINKQIKRLSTMLHRAEECGYKVNYGIGEVRLKNDYIETVALTQDELDRINQISLSKEAAAVRDRFLLDCYTAQRISDYKRIKASDIHDGIITIKQIKLVLL